MARYKPYSYAQGKFIPVFFDKQIQPGTFEYTLNHLIDGEFDLSVFNARFKNDETGAPAYNPKILLKIILFAYSRGIVSSRKIEQACRENIIFMALSADSRPHFTTIADFISSLDKEIVKLFLEVLLVCDEQGLIGREMFAIDGCKLPSNASKEWSGTKADFEKKVAKMEGAIGRMLEKHQEQDLLAPTIEAIRENFGNLGQEEDIFKEAKLTADAGYHNEENMKMVFTEEIDAYIADNQFRKRDPRFFDFDRYKERHKKEVRQRSGSKQLFTVDDFIFPKDLSHCICPVGKRLYRSGANVTIRNFKAFKFKGAKSSCVPCQLRNQCLRYPERTEIRQVAYFTGRSAKGIQTFTEKMKYKIDSTVGRTIYGLRLAIAEPPFANIRSALGLNRFTLQSKKKVNTQWNLFCIVHNLKKIHRYGMGFA